MAPSILICAVALPWMPILCSSAPQKMGLRSPSEPSALTTNLGTTNRLMPLEPTGASGRRARSEEHTSELQSQSNLVCRLLLEKKKNNFNYVAQHSKPQNESIPLHCTLIPH